MSQSSLKHRQQYYKKHRKRIMAYSRARYQATRLEQIAKGKEHRARLKQEVFSHYGGFVCFCCGETNPKFLTLDHKDGNGSEHRRSIGDKNARAQNFWYWLKRNNWPPILQVACYNCNCARSHNGGVCPHRE